MKEEYSVFEKIKTKKSEVLACEYSAWYPRLKKYTASSVIIKPLPQTFLDYLSSDSIKLPPHPTDIMNEIVNNSDNDYSDWEDEDNNEDILVSKPPIVTHEDFIELHETIQNNIGKLGGVVTPKLNWSAPKDARWIMTGNSIRCEHVNDVYLLMNASDHIVDDLEFPFNAVDSEEGDGNHTDTEGFIPELVLREWIDINPAMEFRVFIKDRRIVGISQRDLNHYMFLEALQDDLHDKIDEFVNDVVLEALDQDKYILDVYLPKPFKKVYVIDVNPFTRKSDPLLFTWNELLTQKGEYEFRLINSTNIARFSKKEYSENQVPMDIIDASMNTEAMVELAREWKKLQMKEN